MNPTSCFFRFRLPVLAGLLLLLLTRPQQAQAQNTIGFFPPVLIGLPDTVSVGDSLLVGAVLNNIGPLAYNDSLAIGGYIDTGNGQIPFLYLLYPQASISPFDTLPLLFQVDVTLASAQGFFRIGGNVIVIWPILFDPNFVPGDTMRVPVYVLGSSGIPDSGPPPPELNYYPNPTNGLLHIAVGPGQPHLARIIVSDAQGRLVYAEQFIKQPIKTADWPVGIYFVEFYFEDGQRRFGKIIR